MTTLQSFIPREVQALWQRLSPRQRAGLVGAAAVSVVLLALFANVARGTEYATVFSNLKDEEAAAVVEKLKEKKIPYELTTPGTIRVPASQAQEVKLMAASEGLPQKGGSVGFELFNQPHLGMTEFAEKINYQRALEGELARTIGRLNAVESARVHLVVPQPSLFVRDQKETTASIFVQLKAGRKLDDAQISGISQLVSSSVEGLKPKNVSVMDTAGTLLTDKEASTDPSRQTANRTEVQRALESSVEEDVRTMLARVLGPDNSIVRVSADLDWDQYEANTETYSPQQRAPQVRSQREIAEVQRGAAAAGGVPGASSNIPSYSAVQDLGGQSQGERRDITTNYELSKSIEKLVRAPGGVKRLSVAVALDSSVIADDKQADAIGRLVATAAGLDLNRGDAVTLTSMPFSPAVDQRATQAAEVARQREMVLMVARIVAMILGPLLIAALILLVLRRGRRSSPRLDVSLPPALPGGRAYLEQQTAAALPAPAPAEAERAQLQQELTSVARSDPAAVAQLVRAWLQEDLRR